MTTTERDLVSLEEARLLVSHLEKGDRENLIGGVAAARGFFDWARHNKPELLK
jgi:hypothetical protein